MESVGGVPPSLNQCTKEALFGSLSRLGLHEVFEASRLKKRIGHRIEPNPPLKDLCRIASRQEGMDSLYIKESMSQQKKGRRKHRKAEESIEKQNKA